MKLKKIIFLTMSFPKTIYFNFRAFKLKEAIYLPIIISYNTKIGEIHKNKIKLNNYFKKHYHIIFGWGGSKHVIANKKSIINIGKKANIQFNGKSNFGEGTSLRCDKGNLSFGKNFSTNKNCCISCNYDINFGNDVLLGWNVNVRDTDGHKVLKDGIEKEFHKSVSVGNHVWICSYSDLLKGAKIGNGSIVAWKSCVLKPFEEENVLIGGGPAKVIQQGITWKI